MPVIKDLVVDLSSFFDKYEIIKPYVVPTKLPPEKEWIQSPGMRSRIDEATDCIMCASCYSACPSVWTGGKYLGPAALLQAYRFAADSRDGILRERTSLLASEEGLWRCHTIFNCSEACPKNLNPARFIQGLKRGAAKESMKVKAVASR
jgi:succinate dehydrogenase / fumarate reductase iron-sulfur subunit